MKHRVIVVSLLLAALLITSCSGSVQAEAAAPVEVGRTYRVFSCIGKMDFKILEMGKSGLVKVQIVGPRPIAPMDLGGIWWLNLSQAVLVEAIK